MRIALLEDSLDYAETIKEWLGDEGFEVNHFDSGLSILKHFFDAEYDLCIFDYMLQDMTGPEVMNSIRLRNSHVPPIIFLTARAEEEDVVQVMNAGADDYIIKPSSRKLLIARVRALLRRLGQDAEKGIQYDFNHFKVDAKNQAIIFNNDDVVKLTDKEFDLFNYLVKNEGVLLSRTHLMNVVWGTSADVETRKVDVHISHLRNKLQLTPQNGWKLTSVYQQGYRLERSE